MNKKEIMMKQNLRIEIAAEQLNQVFDEMCACPEFTREEVGDMLELIHAVNHLKTSRGMLLSETAINQK